MKPYIPELSEQRMVRRAPNRPIDFGPDRDYIFSCLKDVEQSFGLQGFPGLAPEQIPARALIKQLIVWWRTLEPQRGPADGLRPTAGSHPTYRYHFPLVGGACLKTHGWRLFNDLRRLMSST